MKMLTLKLDALVVDSFHTGSDPVPGTVPTTATTGMNTYEPGCTTPELCGTTPLG